MVGCDSLKVVILVRIQVPQQNKRSVFAAQKQARGVCVLDSKTLRAFSGIKSARCTETVRFEKRNRGPSLATRKSGIIKNVRNIIIYSILILVLVGITLLFLGNKKDVANNISEDKYLTYKSSEYGPEFTYPKSWGEVDIKAGNKTCPEEDTYRTSDTLNVFDWEFSFLETMLPGSDSIIRTGVRTYELDPKNMNTCGDEFLLKIARKEILPESLSSFQLNSITTKSGMSGTYNRQASRLNTESRTQYTFFINETSGIIHIIQPYISFIPYFDSPELKEMEQKYDGDMFQYLLKGKTSENIRKYLEEFKEMAESLKFSLE